MSNSNHFSTSSNKLTKTKYCNNCGIFGHNYKECQRPITSYGIITFAYHPKSKQYYYLMIRRKDSYGFIGLLRGKYNINDKHSIITLINEMTNKEKNNVLSLEFDDLWKILWGSYSTTKYKYEKHIASQKFYNLKSGYDGKIDYTLESLIKESNTNWDETEWEFPKGLRNKTEYNIQTAIREFYEETGYKKQDIDIIQNLQPFTETYIGSNFKAYSHIYFLSRFKYSIEPYINKQILTNKNIIIKNESIDISNTIESIDISNTIEKSECFKKSFNRWKNDTNDKNDYGRLSSKHIRDFHNCEVSKLKWMTFDDCIANIRPYDYKKLEIIKKIHSIINKYNSFITDYKI